MVISDITNRWFLSEPLLFAALCSHRVVENRDMQCVMRSGKLRIEYNPELMEEISDLMLEMMLRREVIRILLKHPYQRQPLNAQPELLTLASDVTIYQHGRGGLNPLLGTGISLPGKLSFEEYYNLLSHQIQTDFTTGDSQQELNGAAGINIGRGINPGATNSGNSNNSDNSDNSDNGDDSDDSDSDNSITSTAIESIADILDDAKTDASALWEEDTLIEEKMNRIIENAMVTKQWGTLPGGLKGLLKVSMERSLNVRRQLGLFKASILSTQRCLTRMRPSRRYGWEQMGVIHPYTTRLLIAIDTSGSITNTDLRRFFAIVNSFFSYGIPQIDVLQFDADIHLPLISLKKVATTAKVTGRGGTDFQPPVDYFNDHKEYDGMIVFTDGYAPIPKLPMGRRILWALKDKKCYDDCGLNPKIYL